jgi:DNA primase
VTGIDIRGDEARVSGLTVPLSNTGKVLFPADGITKGELTQYYGQVADWTLPYLRDHRYDVAAARRRLATITP